MAEEKRLQMHRHEGVWLRDWQAAPYFWHILCNIGGK